MNNKILDKCIKRMQILKLDKPCIEAFKQGKVWESEGFGALYEVNEQEQSYIDEFEKEHTGCKVYHMIHNVFNFGECYSMLYLSNEESEWQDDLDLLSEGYAFVYVKNVDDDLYSEFGTIAIKSQFGGLVRLS